MKHIVILGAGISGLSLGWFLKRRFGQRISLKIFEKSDRPGGWIRTVRQIGFLFEQGPRSLRTAGAGIETLKLIEQLGIEEKIVTQDSLSSRRYLYTRGKLRGFGLGSLPFSPLFWKSLPAFCKEFFVKPNDNGDESVYQFFHRRFNHFVAEHFADPLVLGIYAGDMHQLSLKSCFPLLYQLEKEKKSVIWGLLGRKKKKVRFASDFLNRMLSSKVFSFRDGMEVLPEILASRLGEAIHYSSEVTSLQCSFSNVLVKLNNTIPVEADHVISAVPAANLSSFFENRHTELTNLLMGIPTVTVAVVCLGYYRKLLKKKGFGYLIPSKENADVLGVVWDSAVFPQHNQLPEETRITVMIRCDKGNKNFLGSAREAVLRHLQIDAEPDAVSVFVAQDAIPQYTVGHTLRVAKIDSILSRIFPRLTLHGNSFYGVSVNDCIANSKKIADNFIL